MGTQQDAAGVPFAIAHDLQQLRLLELPPEMVELVDAPNPPPLSIKSLPPSSAGPYAVLCTPNKSFQLRQVQTSNSLFVTQPSLEAHGNEIPIPATRGIASCAATLELHPSDESATTFLESVLPVYNIVGGGVVEAIGNGKPKAGIFAHVPLSDAQCETGWRELMAFELDDSSFKPSATALSQVWRSINAAALAQGVKLDSQFQTEDILKAVEEEEHPRDLARAILYHLCVADHDASRAWSSLDRAKTVQFVGKSLLEANRGKTDFLIADFTDTWEDRLPEAWRGDAQLKTIEGAYELPSSTSIRVKSTGPATSTGANSDAPSTKKGKWHEKFAKSRKK